jgi:phospholipase C
MGLPLAPLAAALFHGYLALVQQFGIAVPRVPEGQPIDGRDAMAIVLETAGDLFPGLRRP